MGKYDLFFELAKQAGIEEAELGISESRDLSFSLFHGEVDNYTDNNSLDISARGMINGKCGSAHCDFWSKEKAKYLVDEIVKNAKVIENDDPIIFYPGSEKYHKVSSYNPTLSKIPINEKMEKLHELENKIKSFDKRIVEVAGVDYSESTNSLTLINTKGLKLFGKGNYFVYSGSCVAKQNDQTKSGYDYFFDNDFSKLDINKLAEDIANDTLEQLGGSPCDSAKYKAVLAPNVVKSLLKVYVGHADSEEVQKKSSLFIGKLNQKIASSKITIEDKPLVKNPLSRWFDDEGVATYNKFVVKKGVLTTYLYNLTTAAKEGVQSTGNASGNGAKKGIDTTFICLKPGKKTQEELFKQVGDGVYITDVQGLHAGMNPQSGNFSLQSTGFIIKDGKKDRPLDIITVSGNLIDIFKDTVEVANDVKTYPSGVSCSSILIKKISVSGK